MRLSIIGLLLCFFAGASQAGNEYLTMGSFGDHHVNDEYMLRVVSECVEGADSSEQMLDCAGRFAAECMQDKFQGYASFHRFLCADAEASAWNVIMNFNLERAQLVVRETDDAEREGRPSRAEGQPYREPALIEAQLAWKSFLEAECQFKSALWRAGTDVYVAYAQCSLGLTAQRAVALYEITN